MPLRGKELVDKLLPLAESMRDDGVSDLEWGAAKIGSWCKCFVPSTSKFYSLFVNDVMYLGGERKQNSLAFKTQKPVPGHKYSIGYGAGNIA